MCAVMDYLIELDEGNGGRDQWGPMDEATDQVYASLHSIMNSLRAIYAYDIMSSTYHVVFLSYVHFFTQIYEIRSCMIIIQKIYSINVTFKFRIKEVLFVGLW